MIKYMARILAREVQWEEFLMIPTRQMQDRNDFINVTVWRMTRQLSSR